MTTNLSQEAVGEAPDGYEIRWPSFQVWMKLKNEPSFYREHQGPKERLVGTVTAVTEPDPQFSAYYGEKPGARIVYEARADGRNFKARFMGTEEAIRWLIAESMRMS